MSFYMVDEILTDLENHIIKKEPFSLIRFGDGGIKFMHAVQYGDEHQVEIIIEKEGMPINKSKDIVRLWVEYANKSNYIDLPDIYYTRKFWGKFKKAGKRASLKTKLKLKKWRSLYLHVGIKNRQLCNPEVHYLMCMKNGLYKNLLDILSDLNVCCICTCPEVAEKVPFRMTTLKIAGMYEDQHKNSFTPTVKFIREKATKFDIWLVSAGELGRIYTGFIKEMGGVSIDFGFMVDYWNDGFLPTRVDKFIEPDPDNSLELKLTDKGNKYREYIWSYERSS